MLEELLHYDKDFFIFLNNLGSPTWDGFWLFITNKYNAIPLYVLLLVLSYKYLGIKKALLVFVTVVLLVVVTNAMADFFKYGVQRLRPCHNPDLDGLIRMVKGHCGGKFGYFSGHAANSFAIAFFFASLLRKKIQYIAILLLFWAFLMAYSRVYIGVHYPLDIGTGAFVGIVLSWVFIKLYRLVVPKLGL